MPPLLTLLFSQKKSNKNSRMFRSFFFFGFGFCFTIFRVEKGWSSCSIDNRLDGSMNAGKKRIRIYRDTFEKKERDEGCVFVCCITGSLQPCQRGQLTFTRLVGVGWFLYCCWCCTLFSLEEGEKLGTERGKGQRQWRERSVPIPTPKTWNQENEMALISSTSDALLTCKPTHKVYYYYYIVYILLGYSVNYFLAPTRKNWTFSLLDWIAESKIIIHFWSGVWPSPVSKRRGI
jgi:hypothetical protein